MWVLERRFFCKKPYPLQGFRKIFGSWGRALTSVALTVFLRVSECKFGVNFARLFFVHKMFMKV